MKMNGRREHDYDPRERYIDSGGCRVFTVRVYLFDAQTEHEEGYRATSLAEALTMAERAYAGKQDVLIGIPAAEYEQADREGIAYNTADGLLI